MKIHKSGCIANVSCLVIHSDGVCPGPYGKCTCDGLEPKPTMGKEQWEEYWKADEDIQAVFYGENKSLYWSEKHILGFIRTQISKARQEGHEEGIKDSRSQSAYLTAKQEGRMEVIEAIPDEVGYIVRSPDPHVPPMNLPLKESLKSKFIQ